MVNIDLHRLSCDLMLRLQTISLSQFKNYRDRVFDFSGKITGICGKNGMGKTNLLDAIHYLCFTKSHFTRDSLNSQQGMKGFRIEGHFVLNDKFEKAVCVLRETAKKEFSVNDRYYERFSHHIGHYPCVMVAPDDGVLITGGNEERRRFLDELLSQLDPAYLQQLIVYNKFLVQRNSLLRSAPDANSIDHDLLDVLDNQLAMAGNFVFNKRKEFLSGFLPTVRILYDDVARRPEDITLVYESELMQSALQELLMATRQKDILSQRTNAGIHKDDIIISLDNQLFRNMASQGQRKSLLFALKLAELETLKKEKGFAPLLLLDDVFEKLDEERIGNLLQKVCVENDGQVFITDTDEDRLIGHLKALSLSYDLIKL